MIKKILLLFFMSFFFVMCKAPKIASSTSTNKNEKTKEEAKDEAKNTYYSEQVRNDFRAVSDGVKNKFLKDYKATDDQYSILFFTQGFYGEELTIKNDDGQLYKGMITTNKETGLAQNMRILNTTDTKIYDKGTKKTIIIESKKAAKHKFIYVMKDLSNEDKPYKITFSSKLRPAK